VIARVGRLKTYAGFVKLEHTVFSLPVIFAGTLLHARGPFSLRLAGLILLAAVGGRVMAMGLNRIIDAEIDARNPRTSARELPSGAMRRSEAWAVVAASGALYLASAAAIAPVCLQLSPLPVALFVLYPYLKRFTAFAHLGLGLAWSLGPVGGWLASAKTLEGIGEVGWLWLFAVLWVTGFDIIYATMDERFDRQARLHSLPAQLGARKALQVAANLHAMAFLCLHMLWRIHRFPESPSVATLFWLAAIGALFIWQHAVAARDAAFAFFKLNGAIGFLVLGFVWSAI
jgi:4-hydroxybenzoate polyprenyltransferase